MTKRYHERYHDGRPHNGGTPVATQPDEQPVWTIPADLRLRLLAALSTPDQPPKLTFEEFVEWADEDTRAEWVDGEIIMPSPANVRHQQIMLFLARVFATFLEIRPLGSVLVAPFLMKLANAAREPDLLFVATTHRDRLKPTYLDGPADLVVEVVSPESIGRDRGDKFVEYEQAGIPEYWVIDPQAERAEFWRLNPKGRYESVVLDADGVYHSTVLTGLWLREAWLWQEPLPDAEDVLAEVLGDEYLQHELERFRRRGLLPKETENER
jgi:Uma2 family endonuclease